MRHRYLGICAFLLLADPLNATQHSHEAFTEILAEYVNDGGVDYARLCGDQRLAAYCSAISATVPVAITDRDTRLAFWINAYNAFTLKVVCDNYPLESIKDLQLGGGLVGTVLRKTVWDRPLIRIGGRDYTLNQIEHDIIRVEFEDPRIHFALVCAAVSCPPLRREAYEGPVLDAQLDDQARTFLNDREKNLFSLPDRTASLSKILSWYRSDFGQGQSDLLLYLARFLPEATSDSLSSSPGTWRVEYMPYDWGLNE